MCGVQDGSGVSRSGVVVVRSVRISVVGGWSPGGYGGGVRSSELLW